MQVDPYMIFSIIGAIGGLIGMVSILWNISNYRKEQKLRKLEFVGELTPIIDIDYREVERVTHEKKSFVLGEVTLTNRSKYELNLVGFHLSVAKLTPEGLPSLSFKSIPDTDVGEIIDEFGHLDLLFETYYIAYFGKLADNVVRLIREANVPTDELDPSKIEKVKQRLNQIPAEKRNAILADPNAIREYEPEKNFMYYSSMKTGLKPFLFKFLNYTLDVNAPLNIPVLFEYNGEGFYDLVFKVGAIPAAKNWAERAKLLGIGFKKQKIQLKGETEVKRINVSFDEEFVHYIKS